MDNNIIERNHVLECNDKIILYTFKDKVNFHYVLRLSGNLGCGGWVDKISAISRPTPQYVQILR